MASLPTVDHSPLVYAWSSQKKYDHHVLPYHKTNQLGLVGCLAQHRSGVDAYAQASSLQQGVLATGWRAMQLRLSVGSPVQRGLVSFENGLF